jgi:hypothetical protein
VAVGLVVSDTKRMSAVRTFFCLGFFFWSSRLRHLHLWYLKQSTMFPYAWSCVSTISLAITQARPIPQTFLRCHELGDSDIRLVAHASNRPSEKISLGATTLPPSLRRTGKESRGACGDVSADGDSAALPITTERYCGVCPEARKHTWKEIRLTQWCDIRRR